MNVFVVVWAVVWGAMSVYAFGLFAVRARQVWLSADPSSAERGAGSRLRSRAACERVCCSRCGACLHR